jgi:plastocyanin
MAMRKDGMRRLLGAALLLAALAPGVAAQAVVDRTPNLDDGWIVPPGVVQFNFLHRFEVSPPPARKVTSFPNFHLATGLPLGFDLQLDYATNSSVFAGIPNEYQLALRRPLLRQSRGAPVDLTFTGGYNFSPESVDGELGVGRRFGRMRLLGKVRGMTNAYDAQESMWGVGSGAVVRVTDWLSLAGDVFGLVNAPGSAPVAWGGGVQLRIPYTPHSLSIQMTNTQSGSLEGASRGVRGAHMVGFEFTIPFTLSRYLGGRSKTPPPGPAAAPPAETSGAAAAVRIANRSFGPRDIRVRAGTRVQWTNGDQLQHTVTANDASFDSGLIDPGHTFEHVFDRPGTYAYHCTPHPFMTGRIVVVP